jgi:hypothetical protein
MNSKADMDTLGEIVSSQMGLPPKNPKRAKKLLGKG